MGRKKIEFTTEQDVRITQLVNDGYSLNGILSKINDEFSTTFSRSCIDRRIKTLGIIRNKINDEVRQSISRSDVIKYIINKTYFYKFIFHNNISLVNILHYLTLRCSFIYSSLIFTILFSCVDED